MSYRILALAPTGLVPWGSLGTAPIALGRSPNNDLVFDVPTVSWHHAALWLDRGAIWLRDGNSTNGTWLDGERVRGTVQIKPNQAIRLGADAQIEVHRSTRTQAESHAWLVEEIGTGRATRVVGEAALLHDGQGRMASVRVHADGRAELRGGVASVGSVFAVGRAHFRVVPAVGAPVSTATLDRQRFPMTSAQVRVGVAADGRSVVSIEQPGRPMYMLRPSLPSRLFAALAERALADRVAGFAAEEIGWVLDADLARALWPDASGTADRARVLVNRTRGDLTRASLDEALLQRRSGATRLATSDVRVQPL